MPNDPETPKGDTDTTLVEIEGEKPSNVTSTWEKVVEAIPALFVVAAMSAPFITIAWQKIPYSNTVKWVGTVALAAVAAIAIILILGKTKRRFKVIGNGIIIVLMVIAAQMCTIVVAFDTQAQIFKGFVILYFSLLPPWLYLQFISTKGRTLWDEYVLNLFRLEIDDYANLPEPPKRSSFHSEWLEACRANKCDEGNAPELEESIYRKKFEGMFGKAPKNDSDDFSVFRGENLLPVVIATMIIMTGWIFVVKPETIFNISLLPEAFQSSGSPRIPSETFRFGFLGAYFYVLQMLVRRYFQNDLKTSAYVNATMRIIVVVLLIWVLDMWLGENASPGQRSVIAFVVGVFPQVGWQALQALIKLPLKLVVPSLRQQYPLSDLDGLNTWYESRLLEEGIEDMQNLATANLVDVMLNTRIPIERLVDWVDQSLLYLHLPIPADNNDKKPTESDVLRRYGVRTATDFEDVFSATGAFERASAGAREIFIKQFERVLNADDKEPSVVLSIRATLKNEPNLHHVRQWKTFADTNIAKANEPYKRVTRTSKANSGPKSKLQLEAVDQVN
jgi:hypothetical protein